MVEEEEDEYFDEEKKEDYSSSKAKRKRTREWLASMEIAKKKYEIAGRLMQSKVRDAQQLSEGPLDPSIDSGIVHDHDNGVVSHVTSHMLKVISTAYSNHLSDMSSREVQSSFTAGRTAVNHKGEDKDMMDRVRTGILDEFERTRDQYDAALRHGQETSRQRLLNRKLALKKKLAADFGDCKMEELEEEWGVEDGDLNPDEESKADFARVSKTSAIFEDMVDSFLDDPIDFYGARPDDNSLIQIEDRSQPKESSYMSDESKEEPHIPVVSPLVDDPVIDLDSSDISPLKSKGYAPLPPISDSEANRRIDEFNASENANKAEVLHKRQVYEEKTEILMQGLNNNMLRKKQILEERCVSICFWLFILLGKPCKTASMPICIFCSVLRDICVHVRLRRKRDQRLKTTELAEESGIGGRVEIAVEEEQIAIADCERLSKVPSLL